MFDQTIKDFNIFLNSLNERNTISSGDLLTGHVAFRLTKQTKISSITCDLTGKAQVYWSTGSSKNRRHYSARLDVFKLKQAIVPETSVSGATNVLQPGRHMYPFTCQLPVGDFPSSFIGVHGQITYMLKVVINRPWHLSKDFTTQLNFVNRMNYNQPDLWAPLSGSNEKTLCCLGCASGPIRMTVQTQKKAFTIGETVTISYAVDNWSSRTVTPKVKLVQKQVYRTLNGVSSTMCCKELTSKTGLPIHGHNSDVENMIMINVPESLPYTIANCSILEVEYFIQVSLVISHASNLTVLVPIVVCDAYVSTQPPVYS